LLGSYIHRGCTVRNHCEVSVDMDWGLALRHLPAAFVIAMIMRGNVHAKGCLFRFATTEWYDLKVWLP